MSALDNPAMAVSVRSAAVSRSRRTLGDELAVDLAFALGGVEGFARLGECLLGLGEFGGEFGELRLVVVGLLGLAQTWCSRHGEPPVCAVTAGPDAGTGFMDGSLDAVVGAAVAEFGEDAFARDAEVGLVLAARAASCRSSGSGSGQMSFTLRSRGSVARMPAL
jgi:hypothetical protein